MTGAQASTSKESSLQLFEILMEVHFRFIKIVCFAARGLVNVCDGFC
jgi:hypothetical protein